MQARHYNVPMEYALIEGLPMTAAAGLPRRAPRMRKPKRKAAKP